jgi:hypothetical protein
MIGYNWYILSSLQFQALKSLPVNKQKREIIMGKTRKNTTKYEFDIEANYGYGWDVVDCQETRKAANESMREYRVNMPNASYRVKRVKAED